MAWHAPPGRAHRSRALSQAPRAGPRLAAALSATAAPPRPGALAPPPRGVPRRGTPRLFLVVLELACARWVAELAEGRRLALADALAGDVEFLANLLERPGAS